MWFKCEHMSTDDMFLCVHVVSPTDVNDSSDRSQLCKLSSLTVPRSLIKNRRSAANWASSAAPPPSSPSPPVSSGSAGPRWTSCCPSESPRACRQTEAQQQPGVPGEPDTRLLLVVTTSCWTPARCCGPITQNHAEPSQIFQQVQFCDHVT